MHPLQRSKSASSLPAGARGGAHGAAPGAVCPATATARSSSRACQPAVCSRHAAGSEFQPVSSSIDWNSAGSRLASLGAAAVVVAAGALLQCQPAAAVAWPGYHPSAPLVLLDTTSTTSNGASMRSSSGAPAAGNDAVVGQLKRLQQTKQRYGSQEPGAALTDRFTAIQDQLGRIRLLVQINQYDNARMQLRDGAFKNLRSDLRYEAVYRGVPEQVARDVVAGVESLDRQLRVRQGLDAIQPALDTLQQQLQDLKQAGPQ